MKPCKIIVTIELEVTNTKDIMSEGRRVATGATPGNRRDAVMDIVNDRIESVPGLMLYAIKGEVVDWFKDDHILDPRHPEYAGPRTKPPSRRPRAQA